MFKAGSFYEVIGCQAFMQAVCVLIGLTVMPLAIAQEIRVDPNPRQEMMYGMDFERLWHWGLDADELIRLADLAVKQCNVTYVRIAIDGAAEFNEGEYDWSVYDRELECIRALQAANPDIRFFASPRPFHEAIAQRYGPGSAEKENPPYICFPLWIAEFEYPYEKDKRKLKAFHWDKAAEYLVRHVRFLTDEGVNVRYLDVKNENDRYFRPTELGLMADRIREQLGDDVPLIVAPSSYDWKGGTEWLEEAVAVGRTDFFDIAASHNTKNRGNPQDFAEAATKLGKPVWNSELHAFYGPDDVAAQNTEILWQHIRAGFGGINDWLSLGNERKEHKMFRNIDGRLEVMRTYYIFKQLVNTSAGGHYLATEHPDEITSSAAFIQGKRVTVWVLNSADVAIDNASIRLDASWQIEGEVAVTHWGPDNAREGSVETLSLTSGTNITSPIDGRTLYCFEFTLK